MRRFFSGWVVAAVMLGGCVGANKARRDANYFDRQVETAEHAYSLGDLTKAVNLLDEIPEGHSAYGYAQELITVVRTESDEVGRARLKQIDRLIDRGRNIAAKERLEHLTESFPLSEELKAEAQNRFLQIEHGLVESRTLLAELDGRASELTGKRNFHQALQVMRQAHTLAGEVAPETLVQRESVIATASYRLSKNRKPARRRASHKKRRGSGKSKAGEDDVEASAPEVAEAKAPAVAENAVDDEVQRMLDLAAGFETSGKTYNAIVTYLNVREREPTNSMAKAKLSQLQGERQRLIESYLSSANAHFLKQDLPSAMPFYLKVLKLDKDNKAAREGRDMYRNLQRIQKKDPGAGS